MIERTPAQHLQPVDFNTVLNTQSHQQVFVGGLCVGEARLLKPADSMLPDAVDVIARAALRFRGDPRALMRQSTVCARADADPQEIDRRTERLTWETRIFDERVQSLTYVCEVPTLIEQRLYALARTVAEAMARK